MGTSRDFTPEAIMSTYTIESMSDTIAAQATAPGEAAIAIVRISGSKVRDVIASLTQSTKERESHRAFVAQLHDDEGAFEEALVLPMFAPRSYTGEDTVEFHVHGSRPTIARVMRASLAEGARLAQPGEFTLRAFLNGKLDLVQAEAVKDLIHAGSDEALKIAHAHLKGVLSDSLETVETALEGVVADAKAALDFPEYPTGDGLESRHQIVVDGARDTISTLLSRVELGLMKPRRIALCGAPNVGKSSLMNALLGEERVLVDSEAGTTRDAIEVEITHHGRRVMLVDTAGIREAQNDVEARGIGLGRDLAEKCDEQVWLLDAVEPVWPADDWSGLVVVSKIDLLEGDEREQLANSALQAGISISGWISSTKREGLEGLLDLLTGGGKLESEAGIPIVHRRHVDCLERALRSIHSFDDAIANNAPLDIQSFELEEALRWVAQIRGKDVDTALLDRIFSEFCIGK